METMSACLDNPGVENAACAHHLQAVFDCGHANGVSFIWQDGRAVPMARPDGPLPGRFKGPTTRDVFTLKPSTTVNAGGASAARVPEPRESKPLVTRDEVLKRMSKLNDDPNLKIGAADLRLLHPDRDASADVSDEDFAQMLSNVTEAVKNAYPDMEVEIEVVDKAPALSDEEVAQRRADFAEGIKGLRDIQTRIMHKTGEVAIRNNRDSAGLFTMLAGLDELSREEATQVFREYVIQDVARIRAERAEYTARRAAAKAGEPLPGLPTVAQRQKTLQNEMLTAKRDFTEALVELDLDGSLTRDLEAAVGKVIDNFKYGDRKQLLTFAEFRPALNMKEAVAKAQK